MNETLTTSDLGHNCSGHLSGFDIDITSELVTSNCPLPGMPVIFGRGDL